MELASLLALVIIGTSRWGGLLVGITVTTLPVSYALATVLGWLGSQFYQHRINIVHAWYAPFLIFLIAPLVLSRVLPPYIPVPHEFIVTISIALLTTSITQHSTSEFRNIFYGGFIGIAVHGVLTALWYTGYYPFTLAPFWQGQQRFGGLFPDPNAAAMLGFLALGGLTLFQTSTYRLILLVGVLSMGVAAGSRAFLLGIITLGLLYLGANNRRLLAGGIASLILVLLTINAFAFFNQPLFYQVMAALPPALERTLQSINYLTGWDAHANRFMFWKSAAAMLTINPWFGIGTGEFVRVFPFFHPTLPGGWSDNPNNFYLGLLVETGILGTGLLLFSVSRLRMRIAPHAGQLVIWSFLLLLFIGPHLVFLSVAVFFGALVGSQTQDEIAPHGGVRIIALALTVCNAGLLMQRDRGVYRWEYHQHQFRWMGERAALSIECRNNQGSVALASGPLPSQRAVIWHRGVSSQYEISSHPITATFPCQHRSHTPIVITAEKTYSPVELNLSDDPRQLSMMVEYQPTYD